VEVHRVVRRRGSYIFWSRLIGGDEVVSLTWLASFTPKKIPDIHFCLRLSRPQGHRATGSVKSVEKSSDLFGNRPRDLPVCSIVPQPTTLLGSFQYLLRVYAKIVIALCEIMSAQALASGNTNSVL
jgi:hypothetical protein